MHLRAQPMPPFCLCCGALSKRSSGVVWAWATVRCPAAQFRYVYLGSGVPVPWTVDVL